MFNQNMGSADATIAGAREAIAALERDLAGLKGALDSVGTGDLKDVATELAVVDEELKNVRDTAIEAGVALKDVQISDGASAKVRLLEQQARLLKLQFDEAKAAAQGVAPGSEAAAKLSVMESNIDVLIARYNEAAEAAKKTTPSELAQARLIALQRQVELVTIQYEKAALAAQEVAPGAMEQAKVDLLGARVAALNEKLAEASATGRTITVDDAALARTELLGREYNDIRSTLIEVRALQVNAGVSNEELAKTDVQLAQVTAERDRLIEAAAAAEAIDISELAIAKMARLREQVEGARDAMIGFDIAAAEAGLNRITATDLFREQSTLFGEPVRTENGAIPLTSGDRPSFVGGQEEYQRLRDLLLEQQRTAGGGLAMGPGISRITDDIQTGRDLQEAQRAYEAAKLDAMRGPNGAIQLGAGDVTSAEVVKAQELAATYGEIRDRLVEIQTAQANAGANDTQLAKTGVLVAEATDLRDKWLEAAAASKDAGPTDTQIAKAALYAAEVKSARDAALGLDAAGRGGGGGGIGGAARTAAADDGSSDGGLLAGLLPGGRRARPAALFTAAGVALSTGPVIAPAAVAAGAGLAAGLSSLIGAVLTLKLAFADISSAAFKTQKAFDALTPVQQQFVQQLRTIDYGFLRPLEQLASQNTLPGLTGALHAAITPASTAVARTGVAEFGQAIGGGAQDLGSLFGSVDFAKQLGPVFQADAGYVKDFFDGIGNLADAFVRLENAAIPLTDSLDKGVLAFTAYIDNSIKGAQASGQLAGYFDKAKVALHALGGLVHAVGDAFGAFFGAVGFQNSLGVIQTFRDAFEGVAAIINANKTILRDFFAGAIASAQDVIGLVRGVLVGLSPVLSVVNSLTRSFGGWRVVIDTLIALKFVTILQGWATALAGVRTAAVAAETAEVVLGGTTITLGTAMVGATGEAVGLRAALLAIGDPVVLAALAAAAAGAAIGVGLASLVPAGPGAGTNIDVPAAKIAAQRKAGAENIDVAVSYDKKGYYATQQSATSGARRTVPISAAEAAKALGIPVAQLQAQRAAALAPTSSTPAAGADITALPIGLQQQLAEAANTKSTKDDAAADAAVRAYYQALINVTFDPKQRTALLNARAGYVQGGTTPPPLTGTGIKGQLPIGLQTAIDKAAGDAAAGGSTGPEIAAIQKAIDYVQAQIPKTRDKSTQDTLYQERKSLYSELAAAKNPGGSSAVPSGIATLPPGLQASLTNAQTAAANQSAVAGTFNPQNLQAQVELHAQDVAALKSINAQIATQKAGSKELRDLEAERLTLTREEAAAHKQIAEEIKNQKEAAAITKFHKILGISADGSVPTPGAQSLRTRERQILLADAKKHGDLTKGIVSESLSSLIKQLTHEGALPKSSVEALNKINAVINESIKTGTKLDAASSAKVQAYLSEISDTLKQGLGYATNYRAPSAAKLAEAVPGFSKLTHDQQVALVAGFAAKVGHGGTAPTGGAVGGVPLGPDGRPLTKLPASAIPAGGVGVTRKVTLQDVHGLEVAHALSAAHTRTLTHAPPHAVSHSGGDVIIQKVEIYLPNVKDGHQAAQEIRDQLLKTARRNPTQTKGPNAGRRIGMN